MKNKKKFFILLSVLFLACFLRFYKIGTIPPSLYSDEVSQGYNAYSLLLTGKDEHGTFLPVSLRSFGDWKPPLPTFLMIPFIVLNGLNETSVRIPSAVLGVGSIYLTFLIVQLLFAQFPAKNKIALLASFIAAVSPWHILESRAAMLVITALFFLLLSVFFFLKANKDPKNYYLGSFFLALSVYAYYGQRVVAPLIFFLLIISSPGFLNRLKTVVISFLIIMAVCLPLITGFVKNQDVVFGRARTVSVFYDKGIVLRLWELTTQDGISQNPLITRFFHNRLFLYGRQIINNFFSHFSARYLFLEGDKSQPFQIPGMGVLYFIEVIFLSFGFYILFKNYLGKRNFLLFFIFISVLPAAFTFMVPSSNRTFNAVFPFSVVISLGIYFLSKKMNAELAACLITLFYIINFIYFMNIYYIKLPRNYGNIWNYGWRESVEFVKQNGKNYDNIVISDVNGMPYIYFLFYNKYDPSLFQRQAVRSFAGDRFGFEHVEGFDKFIFDNEFDWKTAGDNRLINSLYLVPSDQIPKSEKSGQSIYYPDGQEAVRIF